MTREVRMYHRLTCPPLAPGQEWWTATPYELSRRLRRAQARGEVILLGSVELAPGIHGALVRRVRPAREGARPAVRGVGTVVAIVGPLAFIGWLGWSLTMAVANVGRWQAVLLAGLLLLAALACHRLRRPAHRCGGLHCSGCRG